MATPEDLRMFFAEHASQAKKHEEQREKATNLILTIAGALTGLVTFAKLSIWSLPAAVAIVLLGAFGLLFSGKHYERARMHTEVLRQIRRELDEGPESNRTLSELTRAGRDSHYADFRWPNFRADDPSQEKAKSWIARQRLNVFWEAVHVLVCLIGIGLVAAICVTNRLPRQDEIQSIRIVEGADRALKVLGGAPQPAPAAGAKK